MEKQLFMVIFNGKFSKGILGDFIFKVVDGAQVKKAKDNFHAQLLSKKYRILPISPNTNVCLKKSLLHKFMT